MNRGYGERRLIRFNPQPGTKAVRTDPESAFIHTASQVMGEECVAWIEAVADGFLNSLRRTPQKSREVGEGRVTWTEAIVGGFVDSLSSTDRPGTSTVGKKVQFTSPTNGDNYTI